MKCGISNENTSKIFWHQINFAGMVGVSDSEGNAALLDVIFVITNSFKILNLKAFPQAEPIRLAKTCIALPKLLFTWPCVINAIYST